LGFVPEEIKMSYGRYPENNISQKEDAEIPLTIKIPSINVDVEVYNPQSTSTSVLDSFLAKGAVHYPGSGNLGYGNIFIFGHNTRLAVVNNQGFKAFNGLRDLKEGDLINVYSDKSVFSYKVSSVKLEGAGKALVVFNTQVHKLTLSTCDTFGAKSDRYVVEAEYIGKKAL
jgi:LPXTG-site transpeptidase (sortase) family protein